MEIDKILQQLRSEGEHDSSGGFSLEIDRALELLGRHTLDDPARRVLLVLSSAVAGGATRISFTLGWREWSAAFDGAPFTRDDLEGLVLAALADTAHDRIRDLGVAVGTARTSGATITIESGNTRLIVARSQRVEARDDDGTTTVRIRHDRAWSRKDARRLLDQASPCVPAEVRIDGMQTACLDLRDKVPCRMVVCEGPMLPALLPAGIQRGLPNGRFAAFLWPARDGCGRVTIVLHGVSFVVDTDAFVPTVDALVVVSSARKDLSHARLVVDDSLRSVLYLLRRESVRLVVEGADGPPQWRMKSLQALREEEAPQSEIELAIARCALALYAADDERLSQTVQRAGQTVGRESDAFSSLLRDYLDRCRLRSRAAFSDGLTEAASLCARVVRHQRDLTAPRQLQDDLVRHGIMQGLLGHAAAAISALDEARIIQRDLGLAAAEAFVLECRGLVEVLQGGVAQGTATMRQAADLWAKAGEPGRALACDRDRKNILLIIALESEGHDPQKMGHPLTLVAFVILFSVLFFPVWFIAPLVALKPQTKEGTTRDESLSRTAHGLLRQSWRALDEGLVTLDA